MNNYPVPDNELDRIMQLAALNIDYTDFDKFGELTRLAARIAGTEISLVNLIDAYNQWTVSGIGMESFHDNRENTVCQYTIASADYFEVNNPPAKPGALLCYPFQGIT